MPVRHQDREYGQQFARSVLGTRFEFRGRQFVKTAISMAEDSERIGHNFQGETEGQEQTILLAKRQNEGRRRRCCHARRYIDRMQSPHAVREKLCRRSCTSSRPVVAASVENA